MYRGGRAGDEGAARRRGGHGGPHPTRDNLYGRPSVAAPCAAAINPIRGASCPRAQPAYTHGMPSTTITISTKRDKQVLDITDRVEACIARSEITNGLCNVFVQHTTAALTTGEAAIEGTDEDLMETLERLIPRIKFRHCT